MIKVTLYKHKRKKNKGNQNKKWRAIIRKV